MRGGRSFYGRGGMGLNKKERGGLGTGGATQSVHGNYKSFYGDTSDGFGRNVLYQGI